MPCAGSCGESRDHQFASCSIACADFSPRIVRVTAAMTARKDALCGLRGKNLAAGHVAAVVPRAHLDDAMEKTAAGRIGAAVKALDKAETELRSKEAGNLKSADGIIAGLVAGHPYLGNDRAAYVWSPR